MDSEDLPPNWTAVSDKPSGDAPEENWMEMIKELKAVNKKLEEKLAAAKESEIVKESSLAELEKERDNWKKMAEGAQEKNAATVKERDMLLGEKANLIKKDELAARRQEAMRKLLNQMETSLKAVNKVVEQHCKFCFHRPVQNVFSCGHAVCDECYVDILTTDNSGLESEKIKECHICPTRIEQHPQQIYFS